MGARGRHVKSRNASKRNVKNQKHKPKARKTYSLYQKNKSSYENSDKRKFQSTEHNLKTGHNRIVKNADRSFKRQKIEESDRKIDRESSSETEEEVEDHMKQLRATFGAVDKKSLAIESSDDTESESERDELNDSGESVDHDESDDNDVDGSDDRDSSNNEKSGKPILKSDEETKSDERNEKHADNFIEEDEIDVETLKEEENENDPFAKHIFYDINESLQNSLRQSPITVETHMESWPYLGRLIIQIPCCDDTKPQRPGNFSIAEEKMFAPGGHVPKRCRVNKDFVNEIAIKSQIVNNLVRANKCLNSNEANKFLTELQNEMFSIINNYQDFYYPLRTFENSEEIRFVYCLHAVNHVLKTRTKVLHHNARLSKKDDVPEDFRDQGLTRPKVLIIVPFRNTAYKIIQTLIDILITEDKGNVINKNRFVEDYTGNELSLPKKNPKPDDYELTFAGNVGDDFKIGMTVTKKSLKLYADFYSSDIIIASPLALRYTIGAEGEPERDYDFLASIELLIFDQTDVFLMQNWDHVLHLFNHLHLQPKESHGVDFSRVRTWSLNGWAKYYRQTLIFSSVVLPEINSIFNKKCQNYAGKIRVANPVQFGSVRQVYVQLPHVFQKFAASSVEDALEARFNFFVNNILPQQREIMMKQTLIYVSSYFDYVRIRNYFKREDVGFVQICEYSKDAKVARARDMFFHGDAHFLLYTERHHFYNRIRVKGVRHIVFYQPPNFPHFYYEMCNLMQEANMNKKIGSMSNMTVTVLYSKYDVHQLAAVVGTERVARMIQSEKNVHMLVTDAD